MTRAMLGRIALIVALALGARPGESGAQDVIPSPVPSCAVPNVDAKTIYAARPIIPPLAAAQHIDGQVVVRITLDDRSQIVSASVVRSASVLLNQAAIDAAKASKFVTRIRDCVPVGDSYNFIVNFIDYSLPPSVAPASMASFFGGAWRCVAADGAIVRVFGLNGEGNSLIGASVRPGPARGAFSLTTETYTQRGGTLSVFERTQTVVTGTSSGWNGDRLTFATAVISNAPPNTGTITYERTDADHFTRTETKPGSDGTVASTETCARIAASP